MANPEITAAQEYHQATNHSPQSVQQSTHRLDWTNQPRPYKLYAGLPVQPLPDLPPESHLPALAAIASAEIPRDRPRLPDLDTLTAVLHYSAGITRRLRYAGGIMEFRAAACTGALYHIEIYLVCGDLPGLEAGVYQFGAHDGALRRLRSGDWRAVLVDATAHETAIVDAPAVLVYTSTFWRNAWKYQARAYRHSFWDAGTIIANTLALTAAHELPAHVVGGFVDRNVNLLLDLDMQREVALALMPIGYAPEQQIAPAPPLDRLGLETVPPSRHEVDYPLIRAMHEASSLTSPAEVDAWRNAAPALSLPPPSGPLVPLLPLDPATLPVAPIEAVIRRRGSSRRFAQTPIGSAVLATMLRDATRGIPADYRASIDRALAEPYLILNRVDGIASGAYRYRRDLEALELLRQGDFTEQAGYLDLGQELGAEAAADAYFLADLNEILPTLGNRGYRAAQLDAAIEAGKLYLAIYALGLGATGLTFFDDDAIEFFSPQARGQSVMFLLALGVPARRRAPA